MTTHITKTWFDGDKVVTQEIAESEVYKQEPVAWVADGVLMKIGIPEKYTGYLYTTPPAAPVQMAQAFRTSDAYSIGFKDGQAAQRQPLTEEQIDDIWNRYCDEMGEASINDAYDIARAIEAAHGITGEKT